MKPGLISFDEALAALLARAEPVGGIETVATIDAGARVLAADLCSTIDVPPMDNSQMDGYAVRSADLAPAGPGHPASLRVAQRIAAGQVGSALEPGCAARIFTGAPVPEGADAIVMQEAVRAEAADILIDRPVTAGEWIRRRGEDVRRGSVILEAGQRLSPQAVGLAASVGLATIPVRRRLRVACFFTGDELAQPGEPLKPGAIYDSNRYMLVSLLRRLGCEVTDLARVPDDLQATRQALREAAAGNDLILSSGGMSVGEEDHVRPALQAEGELAMWQIAMKPGKPLAWGRVGAAHFIGLPGNPVSAFVTFLMLVRPVLLRLQGVHAVEPEVRHAVAAFDWIRPDARREFLRATCLPDGRLQLFPNQGSAVLTSVVQADGLIDNPPGHPIRAGDAVRFLPLAALLG
jgi:molybdopterin molybdotransferase